MASKLDQAIAEAAIALGQGGWPALATASATAARGLTPKDLAKLPDRWAPAFSAAKAGVPELKDAWGQLWFEAVNELLYSRGTEGLDGLLTLWERDAFTYPEFPLVRLLRLADGGVEAPRIMDRVGSRLAALNYPFVFRCVGEVAAWAPVDPGPLGLLRTFATLAIRNGDGETIGELIDSGRFGPDRRAGA